MRRSPTLESLEGRQLLSVSLPGIGATQPADGQGLVQAPQRFVITFNPADVNQIDNLYSDLFGIQPSQTFPTLVASDNDNPGDNAQVEIDRIGPGGVATPLLGSKYSAPLQWTLTTVTGTDGSTTQSQLIVTPAAGDPALVPGAYQLDILPETGLASAFSLLYPSSAWSSTQPITIAQFTVLGQGATLGDATRLGDLGPAARSVSGFVNPQGSQSAVALYQFTLPPGQSWQLNAQVLSQAIGSSLQPGIALFNSKGDVLATQNGGQGSSNDPTDPSLIKGLAPGTYYIGISGSSNLPGWQDGYDPKTGTPGTAAINEPDGAFRLDLFAQPTVSTTSLASASLNYLDAHQPSPTGMELTFSGPVDVTAVFTPDRQESALEVDASGRVWPITASSYQVGTDTLNFFFDEALPAGRYSLLEPAQGGLTDPSGLPVNVPSGNSPGVLASWSVAPQTNPSDTNDLGVVWPGPVNVTWNSAITRTAVSEAGQPVAYRFVVICPGSYSVQTQVTIGQFSLEVKGADGTTILVAENLTGLDHTLVNLGAGVYSLLLTPVGSQPAAAFLTLKPVALDYEKLIANGVGQSPVLTLVLTATALDNRETTAISDVVNSESIAAISAGHGVGFSSGAALSASPIPSSLLLVAPDTGLMGLPGTSSQIVSAVGPMVEGALASVADRVNGLLPGIRYASSSDLDLRVGNSDSPEVLGFASSQPADPRAAGSAGSSGSNSEETSARDDALALARADRIGTWIENLFMLPSRNESAAQPSDDGPTTVVTADLGENRTASPGLLSVDLDPVRSRPDPSRVNADLRAPLGLIAVVAGVYSLRMPIIKWWGRNTPFSTERSRRTIPWFVPDPHFRTNQDRTIRRARPAES